MWSRYQIRINNIIFKTFVIIKGIDDVFALSVALQQEDILAITIAGGNTPLENAALNAKLTIDKLLGHKKHNPEIFLGADKSLTHAAHSDGYFSVDGLGNSKGRKILKIICLI